MSLTSLARRLGNELYKFAFPLYRPLYRAFKSYADRAERELLARNLDPGAVVVDAGANIGIYSQFLAQLVGANGVVHSFEPDPENFRHLREALSFCSNVQLNQMAVSDRTGYLTLYVSDSLNVDHRAYPTAGERRRMISIRSTALDDYFKPGARVDMIKMDIQGYELHALRGAIRVLAENPGIKLLLECWPYGLREAGSSARALEEFLQQSGFTILRLSGSTLERDSGLAQAPPQASHYFNIFARRDQSSNQPLTVEAGGAPLQRQT